jgi:O-antigen/teichoic acid export membrane protein
MTGAHSAPPAAPGAHERRLAAGALAQQGSFLTSTLVMLVVVTVVARSRSLSAFGLYGLLISVSSYMVIAQSSVEGGSLRALAAARTETDRDRAFSVALILYTANAVVAAAVVLVVGSILQHSLRIPAALHHQAQHAVIALAAVTACGWPLKIFADVLRGTRRLIASACAEIGAYLAVGAASVVCVALHGPLWLLIAIGGAVPLLIGLCSAALFAMRPVEHHLRPRLADRASLRSFASTSAYLFVLGLTSLVVYSLDRLVLATFRSAATVGLYEGPVRAHNLVRTLSSAMNLLVLPTAAAYVEAGDRGRLRDLLLRGTRYSAAATVPVTIGLMVMAKPILAAWLGSRYAAGGTAMTILVGYWLTASSTAVAGAMLIAAGRARALVIYGGLMATLNLGLSLALTPSLGLNGVVLGTTIPYVVCGPLVLVIAIRTFDVTLTDFIEHVWRPVFSLAMPLAAVLIVVRLTVPLHHAVVVGGVTSAAVAGYWLAFYGLELNAGERLLIRSLVSRRAHPA